jgi:uncharacterized phage protein gp47/JayE
VSSYAASISSTGISAPTYAQILAYLTASYQAIYGADAVLTPDSQDGQWLAILAKCLNDTNQAAVAVYNSFSPATAQGAGLSSNVKLNGLRREASSNSTAPAVIVGQVGTTITNGVVADPFSNQWSLPASVVIPVEGEITVTLTAVNAGALALADGTVMTILTPTRGWQSTTTSASATMGNAVETDAALRQRQSVSAAMPAVSPLDAVIAAVANVPGVIQSVVYENPTGSTDGNGIPSHSISAVVEGGDTIAVATAIAANKTPGTGTYGTTTEVIVDQKGVPNSISFFELDFTEIFVTITIKALAGYVSTTGTALVASVAAFINSLSIGEESYLNRLYGPANLNNALPLAATYNVTSIVQGLASGSQSATDLPIAFNKQAQALVANITLVVT